MTNPPTRTYTVPGMSCDHCVTAITDQVQPLHGVERLAIDLGTKTVTVVGGDDETIVAGYDIE